MGGIAEFPYSLDRVVVLTSYDSMSKLLSSLASPTGLLCIFFTLTQVVQGIYWAGQLEPPGSFTWVHPYAFLWVLGWWLLTDSRKRGIKLVYDMGMFLYIAWPIFMPYYLLKTRGVRGMLVIIGFVGIWVVALIAGMALYLLLAPQSAWPEY